MSTAERSSRQRELDANTAQQRELDANTAQQPEVDAQAPAPRSTMATTLLMASGTLVSRVLGFVRAALIAFVLGNGTRPVEAFNLANTIPNSLYILLAGGVMNAVLVPQIVRAMDHDEDRGEAYTNRIMTAFLAALAVLTLIVTVATPWVMRLYTSAGWREPAMEPYWGNMVMIAYLCMPQIFFYGAYVLVSQVLNSRQHYVPVMWAPIANNVVAIGVFAIYLAVWGVSGGEPFTTGQEWLLGGGATVGIITQFLILMPFLRRAGFQYRPRWDLKGAGLTHTFKLAQWTIYFVLANQLAIFVVNRLASTATLGGEGAGLTAYQNASLIWIVPHSLITLSLGTMMITTSSKLAAAGDMKGVAAEAVQTMRNAMTVIVPCAVAFLFLGVPLSQLLFGNGAGAEDAIFIGRAISVMALGLMFYSLHYLTIRVFYALEDTRTPFFIQLGVVATNILTAVLFVVPFHAPGWVAAGLGGAYALAYVAGFSIAVRLLKRRLPEFSFTRVGRHIGRLLAAVAPAGLIALVIVWLISRGRGQLMLLVGLAVAGVVAILVFLILARMLSIREVSDVLNTVLRRGRRTPGDDQGSGEDDGPQGPGPDGDGPGGAPEPAGAGSDDVTRRAQAGPAAGPPAPGTGAADAFGFPDREPTPAQEPQPVPAAFSSDPASPAADPAQESGTPSHVRPGDVLGGRFELIEPLTGPRRRDLWRARDTVLRRFVVCQIFAPEDSRTDQLMSAARLAATAVDSRFVRILDVADDPDSELGSYVVREYAPGYPLSQLLAVGRLSPEQSAWLVREVADALSTEHQRGLSHERLHPDAIMVTDTGNVKILGWQIDRMVFPADQEEQTGEDADMFDLGRLLYACLTSTWPGAETEYLPGTPVHGGMWPKPGDLAPVPGSIDRITQQVLGLSPMMPNTTGRPDITTASQLVHELNRALGGAEYSQDLERRVRQMSREEFRQHGTTSPQALSDHTRVVPVVPPVTARRAVDPEEQAASPAPRRAYGAPDYRGPRRTILPPPPDQALPSDTPFGAATGYPMLNPFAASTAAAQHTPRSSADGPTNRPGRDDDQELENTFIAKVETPVGEDGEPAPMAARPRVKPKRHWIGALLVLAVAALVVGLIGVAIRQAQDTVAPPPEPTAEQNQGPTETPSESPSETPSVDPPQEAHTISDSITFDPNADGGNGEENPQRAELAYDGDATTAWFTMAYVGDPQMGGLKPGVGLILDLGEVKDVSTVSVALMGDGSDVELRVPTDTATETAPTGTIGDWQVLDSASNASGTVDLSTANPVEARYVMIYFTSLAPDGGEYRSGIYEVQVGN